MKRARQSFGGDWTEEKLKCVHKYLCAYTKIMSKQRFKFAYIDAFAGTGYRTERTNESESENLFPKLAETEPQEFRDGSARIALKVDPPFDSYIFIEKSAQRCNELEKLKAEFPTRADRIKLVNDEANNYLLKRCLEYNWTKHRAVLFLDPYGMQVRWATIEAIAKTKAIDLWLLFPLGVAVNRLLTKSGNINAAWRHRLNEMFGTTEWEQAFYSTTIEDGLFGAESSTKKIGKFNTIAAYFLSRLKTVFADAAEPLLLTNSSNTPLYMLCFAAANPKGAKTAIKIAKDILGK
jgi:three-Cys-motif partner protein